MARSRVDKADGLFSFVLFSSALLSSSALVASFFGLE
ncbi:hypothetical protein ACP70R_034569 [Stipagrostis hirtigluma subsp. patula]